MNILKLQSKLIPKNFKPNKMSHKDLIELLETVIDSQASLQSLKILFVLIDQFELLNNIIPQILRILSKQFSFRSSECIRLYKLLQQKTNPTTLLAKTREAMDKYLFCIALMSTNDYTLISKNFDQLYFYLSLYPANPQLSAQILAQIDLLDKQCTFYQLVVQIDILIILLQHNCKLQIQNYLQEIKLLQIFQLRIVKEGNAKLNIRFLQLLLSAEIEVGALQNIDQFVKNLIVDVVTGAFEMKRFQLYAFLQLFAQQKFPFTFQTELLMLVDFFRPTSAKQMQLCASIIKTQLGDFRGWKDQGLSAYTVSLLLSGDEVMLLKEFIHLIEKAELDQNASAVAYIQKLEKIAVRNKFQEELITKLTEMKQLHERHFYQIITYCPLLQSHFFFNLLVAANNCLSNYDQQFSKFNGVILAITACFKNPGLDGILVDYNLISSMVVSFSEYLMRITREFNILPKHCEDNLFLLHLLEFAGALLYFVVHNSIEVSESSLAQIGNNIQDLFMLPYREVRILSGNIYRYLSKYPNTINSLTKRLLLAARSSSQQIRTNVAISLSLLLQISFEEVIPMFFADFSVVSSRELKHCVIKACGFAAQQLENPHHLSCLFRFVEHGLKVRELSLRKVAAVSSLHFIQNQKCELKVKIGLFNLCFPNMVDVNFKDVLFQMTQALSIYVDISNYLLVPQHFEAQRIVQQVDGFCSGVESYLHQPYIDISDYGDNEMLI